MYSVTMVGTKEPIARADEHNRHPNIVVVRIPNLLRRPPEAGLVKHITLTTMDVNHAETQKNYVNVESKQQQQQQQQQREYKQYHHSGASAKPPTNVAWV